MSRLTDRQTLQALQLVAGVILFGVFVVAVWLGTVGRLPAGIGLFTVAVGLVGLWLDWSRREVHDGMAPETMCFTGPIVLITAPPAAPGGPPWRVTFLVLGAGTCAFGILVVGLAHREMLESA